MKAPWMKTPAETRLGRLLIEAGLIDEGHLTKALEKQAASRTYVPLGRLLVDDKLITARQLAHVLEQGNKRPKLGEVLLRSGSITELQLEQALQEQQRSKRPLGEVLIRLGHLTDEAMRQALCLQLDVPFVDLDRVNLDRTLTRLINRSYARRHWLVPIAQVGHVLTISMNDPTKTAIVEELSQLTGYVVSVVTSSQEAIKRAFKRLYEQAVDQPVPGTEAPQPSIETIAMSDEPDGEPGSPVKSRYVEEYIQDKKADSAVRQLLALALERRCSDIHLEMLAGRLHARFRIDGILQELQLGAFQQVIDQTAREIVSRVKVLAKLDIAERRRPQDGSFRVRFERKNDSQNIDFRVSIVPSYYGESCVLRILDKTNAPTNIDQLGFSPAITARLKQLLQRPAGLLLVTGPTGSGKSTTLYASLMTAYRPEVRVLTAEDPIEYVYEQFSQSEVNERIGNTFSRYLRAFLRHDPEIILIGEIRDEETAEMSFRAAQTGHLLLSTLHTNDAISAVTRLQDMKVDPNLIASSMLGVLAQRLARVVCPMCKQPYRPSAELLKEFFAREPEGLTFYRGTGCANCNFTGYRGRTSIAELWTPSEEDVILISKSAPFDDVRVSARRSTISMAEDVIERLSSGKTNLEELIRVMPVQRGLPVPGGHRRGFPRPLKPSSSHHVEHGGDGQRDRLDLELFDRRAGQDPRDREAGGDGDEGAARRDEGLAAGADVPTRQLPRRRATEKVHREHADVREQQQLAEGAEERQGAGDRRVHHDRVGRRPVAFVHAGEERRQEAVPAEREQDARRPQDVPAQVPGHRNHRAREHHRAPGVPQEHRAGRRERRGRTLRERRTEHAACHELDHHVEKRHHRERQEDRPRDGSGRILELSARHQRDFRADEREDQRQDGASQGPCRRGQGRPDVFRVDEEDSNPDEEGQRQQLGDRHDLDGSRADVHAADVEPAEGGEGGDDERRAAQGRGQHGEGCSDGRGERARHRRDTEDRGKPVHHAGQEADVAAERRFHVGVDAAGQRDPAARHGEAGDDERNRCGAGRVGEGGGGADARGHHRRQHEDARPDRAVDDARRERAHPDGAHERRVTRGRHVVGHAAVWRMAEPDASGFGPPARDLLRGFEAERRPVRTVAEARRRGAILEDVAEVPAAAPAVHLGAHHAVAAVDAGRHRALDRVGVARPPRAARVLRVRREQQGAASRAVEAPVPVFGVERVRPRRLGAVLPQHAVLLGSQRLAPLLLALPDCIVWHGCFRDPLTATASVIR